jgi:hypothetical protein
MVDFLATSAEKFGTVEKNRYLVIFPFSKHFSFRNKTIFVYMSTGKE